MARQDPIELKVEAGLKKLTLARKIELIGGYQGFDIMPIPELGLPKVVMNDGPLGVRGDNISKPATAYPAGVALASAWDPMLAHDFGEAVARDAQGRGVGILLGPGVNLARITQNGRNFEYYGEDPYLASRTAVGMIEGLQGQGVVATVKHFVANNHENDRFHDSSDISERALRELYLKAFEVAVKEAKVGAVMCSYNKLNGTYTSENSWLLQDVLRKEWGFNGLLMSDWGAVHSTLEAALNGMDLEMPGPANFDPKKVEPLVTSGKIPVAVIDEKVRRILRTEYTFHLDEPPKPPVAVPAVPAATPATTSSVTTPPVTTPPVSAPPATTPVTAPPPVVPDVPAAPLRDDPRNAVIARRIAEEGTVLLKNERKLLPLDPLKKINVVFLGYNALYPVPVGGGSAEVVPLHQESLLSAMSHTSIQAVGLDSADPDIEKALNFRDYRSGGITFNKEPGGPVLKRLNDGLTSRDYTSIDPSPVGMGVFSGNATATYRPATTGAYWLVSRCQGKVSVGLGWSHTVQHTDTTKRTILKQMVFLEAGHDYRVSARFTHESGDLHIAFGFVPAVSPLADPAKVEQLRKADLAVIGVGFNPYLESEGTDRSFDLPMEQQELIRGAIKLHKKILLVVNSGAGVNLEPFAGSCDGIIQAWYPGQEGAEALANIILGKVNPSGKLATSFPKTLAGTYYVDAYPPKDGHVAYKEDLLIGYRWFDTKRVEPLFPFGFGLTYTTFSIPQMKAAVVGDNVIVEAIVKNTGKREGADVIQVYAGLEAPTPDLPVKELKAFVKVRLKPKQDSHETMSIPLRELAHWDTDRHCWHLRKGNYTVYVGESSRSVKPISVVVPDEKIFNP